MVDGRASSVYDLDFADVYDIDFDDVSVDGHALLPDTHTTQMDEPVPIFENRPTNQLKISDEVRELARGAITGALQGDFKGEAKRFSPMFAGKLRSIIQVEHESFDVSTAELKEAMRQDDRLIEFGGSFYPGAVDIDPDAYWPYDPTNVDKDFIQELVEIVYKGADSEYIGGPNVLGIIRGAGYALTPDESHELYAAVCSDKRFTPRENGGFDLHAKAPIKKIKNKPSGSNRIFTDGETIVLARSKTPRSSADVIRWRSKRRFQRFSRGKHAVNIGSLMYSRQYDEKTCLDPERDPRKMQPNNIEEDYFKKPKSNTPSGKSKGVKQLGKSLSTTGKVRGKHKRGLEHGKKSTTQPF